MLGTFDSVKNLISIPTVQTDNSVFRLHYRFTVAILLCGVVLGTSQLFGKFIECINNDDFPEDLVSIFCWIHATFSIPSAWNKTVGEQVPYPGVGKHVKGQDKIYHKYYQWVYLVLFVQAVFFYIPRYIWRMFECKRIHNLVLGLNMPILSQEEEKKEGKKLLVEYLRTHFGHHRLYVIPYVICEVLNLVNVIGQMYLIDDFLGGEFTTFGTKVLEFTGADDQEFRNDPMVRIFPRMTKCTIHRYGPSGGVNRHDAFCLLPLNIINEKIYIFLWFWFIILTVITALALVYRSLTIISPKIRKRLLISRARLSDRRDVELITDQAGFGDWFVLYLLCKNLDPVHYGQVLKDFAGKLPQTIPQSPASPKKSDKSRELHLVVQEPLLPKKRTY